MNKNHSTTYMHKTVVKTASPRTKLVKFWGLCPQQTGPWFSGLPPSSCPLDSAKDFHPSIPQIPDHAIRPLKI